MPNTLLGHGQPLGLKKLFCHLLGWLGRATLHRRPSATPHSGAQGLPTHLGQGVGPAGQVSLRPQGLGPTTHRSAGRTVSPGMRPVPGRRHRVAARSVIAAFQLSGGADAGAGGRLHSATGSVTSGRVAGRPVPGRRRTGGRGYRVGAPPEGGCGRRWSGRRESTPWPGGSRSGRYRPMVCGTASAGRGWELAVSAPVPASSGRATSAWASSARRAAGLKTGEGVAEAHSAGLAEAWAVWMHALPLAAGRQLGQQPGPWGGALSGTPWRQPAARRLRRRPRYGVEGDGGGTVLGAASSGPDPSRRVSGASRDLSSSTRSASGDLLTGACLPPVTNAVPGNTA